MDDGSRRYGDRELGLGYRTLARIVPHQWMRRSGFTLVEVLLVLALLAIIAAMTAGVAVGLIDAAKVEPPERVLKRAVLDAVYHASEHKEPAFLRYLRERATFVVTDATGETLSEHPVYEEIPTGEDDKDAWEDVPLPKVTFLAEGPLSGESGGSTQLEEEHLELVRVPFQSGVSPPFKAMISFLEKEQVLRFDPFSGYVIKGEED